MATTDVSSNTEYLYPSTWTNLTDTAANYAAGIPAWSNQTYQNWYDQPLSTGQTTNQTTAWNAAMNPTQQWTQGVQAAQGTVNQAQPYYNQAAGALTPWASTIGSGLQAIGGAAPLLSQAAEGYMTGANYDPTQLQGFLNPYTQQAAQATVSDLTRNLTENILPGVNTTFTGAGQFGSSRNKEFGSRALRDTQEAAAKALATANYGAYNSAQQAYSDWANKQLTAAGGLGTTAGQQAQLGTALGALGGQYGNVSSAYQNLGAGQTALGAAQANLAQTGAGMTQQQLTNMLGAANQQQQQQQQTLTTAYEDWLKQQQFPLSTLSTLGGATGAMSAGTRPNVSVPVSQPDDVTKILAGIQAAQSGLSDTSVQSVLDYLFGSGTMSWG